MYVPPRFEPEEESLRAFVRAAEFGLLLSNGEGGGAPRGTHLPVMVEERDGALSIACHLARGNPQWQALEGQEVLLVLQGPGAYVSPAWYDTPDVPTWNYLSAHVQARVALMEGNDFRTHLIALVERHEQRRRDGVDPGQWDEGFIEQQMRGAVGLRLAVTRLEGAFKLSQNKTDAERERVAEGLASEGGAAGQALARCMKND
jgi:transcriptional regulator